jgi:hypothetical protein
MSVVFLYSLFQLTNGCFRLYGKISYPDSGGRFKVVLQPQSQCLVFFFAKLCVRKVDGSVVEWEDVMKPFPLVSRAGDGFFLLIVGFVSRLQSVQF